MSTEATSVPGWDFDGLSALTEQEESDFNALVSLVSGHAADALPQGVTLTLVRTMIAGQEEAAICVLDERKADETGEAKILPLAVLISARLYAEMENLS